MRQAPRFEKNTALWGDFFRTKNYKFYGQFSEAIKEISNLRRDANRFAVVANCFFIILFEKTRIPLFLQIIRFCVSLLVAQMNNFRRSFLEDCCALRWGTQSYFWIFRCRRWHISLLGHVCRSEKKESNLQGTTLRNWIIINICLHQSDIPLRCRQYIVLRSIGVYWATS